MVVPLSGVSSSLEKTVAATIKETKGMWRETDLGDENVETGVLVVPTEFVYIVFCTEGLAICCDVVQI